MNANIENILEVKHLKTQFSTDEGIAHAVEDVSFDLRRGETLGIVGESSSGKSVTMLSVMRLVTGKITDGEILFEGKDLLKMPEQEMIGLRGKDITMVFQDPMTSLDPVYTIGYQLMEPILKHQKVTRKEAFDRAVEMLDKVGISNPEARMKEYPHQLSGGMRQRVIIAMALTCNPKLLIADEPTTALDVTIQAQILELMKKLKQAVTYLTIYFGGIVFFVMYNTAAGILRAVGNVRVPLYCLFASSALNILLDLILVIVFKMGVAGVAYATIFSQAVATAISMWVLLRREANFDVNVHRYPLDGRLAWTLLGMGIPTGFQKTITSFSNVLVLSHITFFGEACLAGWTVYNKIDHLLTVFAQSISSSLSTFVSQNLGAKQHQRIEKGVQVSLWAGAALFTGIIAVLVLSRGPLVRIFGSDPEMIYYAERFMLYITFFKISQLVMNVFVGALRGAGHMTLVTLLMLSGIVLFRQLYLLVITLIANNPWLVGLSYPAGWTFAAAALMSVYLFHARKEWRRQSAEITGGC